MLENTEVRLSLPVYNFFDALFNSEIAKGELSHTHHSSWTTEFKPFRLEKTLLQSYKEDGKSARMVGWTLNCLTSFEMQGGRVYIGLASKTQADIKKAIKFFKEEFPVPPITEEQAVSITFWHHTAHGPKPTRRKLKVPNWSEIRENYAEQTTQQLDELLQWEEPRGGKLILWWGPPGTGKTYALRALAWEWRKWAQFYYLIDPEVLFGGASADLMSILLDDDDEEDDTARWRFLILEDTGEMLTPDAKEHVGQGLSRLLNLVDGLIGQGLRVGVLVTTNEKLEALHPAVARPGRTGAQIYFDPLTPVHARRWLAARGIKDTTVSSETTLAELYAQVNDWMQQRGSKTKHIGFSKTA